MKKLLVPAFLLGFSIFYANPAAAWGRRGHKLVAELAYQFMDSLTKQKLRTYLGSMTPDEAGNWMDDQRSNSYYQFMRTWHYLDFEKGEEYKPVAERNIITVMFAAYNDLKKGQGDKKEIKRNLLLLFHLVGDLHQPLHVGYASDRGGNDVTVSSDLVSGNLHSIWDTQMPEYADITMADLNKVYESLPADEVERIRRINMLGWFKQSRSLLDSVYGFQNNFLDKAYIDRSVVIIKKQLVLGGLRLASMLTDIYGEGKKPEKSAAAGLPASLYAAGSRVAGPRFSFGFFSLFGFGQRNRLQVS